MKASELITIILIIIAFCFATFSFISTQIFKSEIAQIPKLEARIAQQDELISELQGNVFGQSTRNNVQDEEIKNIQDILEKIKKQLEQKQSSDDLGSILDLLSLFAF